MNSSATMNLDGNSWLLSTDPENVGRNLRWYDEVISEAKATRVPASSKKRSQPTTALYGTGMSLLRRTIPMKMGDIC